MGIEAVLFNDFVSSDVSSSDSVLQDVNDYVSLAGCIQYIWKDVSIRCHVPLHVSNMPKQVLVG